MRGRTPSKGALTLVGLVIAATFGSALGARQAGADERPTTSSAVQVQVQGGGSGVEPVSGAPPAVTPALETRAVAGTLAIPASAPKTGAALPSLRAVSTAEGEASLEIDGVRETVRVGSRVGRDTVKAVSTGRLVLERPSTATQPSALVIVTFDGAGRAKERVFWTSDPTVKTAPQVSQR